MSSATCTKQAALFSAWLSVGRAREHCLRGQHGAKEQEIRLAEKRIRFASYR